MREYPNWLPKECVNQIQLNACLKRFNTWKIGGLAEILFKPNNVQQLQTFIKGCPKQFPLTILGLGSNVLVPDSGIKGAVVLTHFALNEISYRGNYQVYAQAGTACAKLARFAAKQNLAGAHFFAGIPGTVGGALKMNAGAFGSETWSRVVTVKMLNTEGKLITLQPSDFKLAYRSVKGQEDAIFVGATFEFNFGEKLQELAKIKDLLTARQVSQPVGKLSCGSVFKNPTGNYAAKLIEAIGLKGYTIGNAQFSEKHANFIINLGSASAQDVLSLIQLAVKRVQQQFNILLEPEVRILS